MILNSIFGQYKGTVSLKILKCENVPSVVWSEVPLQCTISGVARGAIAMGREAPFLPMRGSCLPASLIVSTHLRLYTSRITG